MDRLAKFYHVGVQISSVQALDQVAYTLAHHLCLGRPLLLYGPLGAGKTTLARQIIRHLCGPETEVPSPTFPLVLGYTDLTGRPLWHSDLYRLDRPDQILALGLEEIMATGLCLIEWPERLGAFLPSLHTSAVLAPDEDDPNCRHLILSSTLGV